MFFLHSSGGNKYFMNKAYPLHGARLEQSGDTYSIVVQAVLRLLDSQIKSVAILDRQQRVLHRHDST